MARARMRRVDEAVRAVLSETISTDLSDPRVGFVTVTQVKTSPDLRHARVYVSVLGTDEERNKLNEMLRTSMTGGISRAFICCTIFATNVCC